MNHWYFRRFASFLVLLAQLKSCLVVGQYSTRYPCYQSRSAVVVIRKDQVSGNYTVVERVGLGGAQLLLSPDIQVRKLELSQNDPDAVEQYSFRRSEFAASPGLLAEEKDNVNTSRKLEKGGQSLSNQTIALDDLEEELYYAWECSCFNSADMPTVYCPLEINTCLRPSQSTVNMAAIPGCRNVPQGYDFRRFSCLLIVTWTICLMVFLITSNNAASVIGFLVSWCDPLWNKRVVQRLIESHPERVRRMLLTFIATRPLEASEMFMSSENDSFHTTVLRNTLVLRTKLYDADNLHNSKIQEEDEEDPATAMEEEQCTICFASFADRDRVGSLKCGHLFHSDCLKMWLERRNVCPLCQTEGIAESRFEQVLTETEASLSTRNEESEEDSDNSGSPVP